VLAGLLGAVAAVAVLAYLVTAFYFADAFTRTKRRRVQCTPASVGLRYDDVQFRTADLAILRGWYLESPGARASVLMLHDGDGTRSDRRYGMLGLIRDYVSHGYNVFAFDLRGRGESSGGRDRLGGQELIDTRAAFGYLQRRSGSLPIIVHGFGLGASLAIQGVADGLPARAVIADSPFASAVEQLRSRWERVPGPLFRAACRVARHIYGADVNAVRPIEAMTRWGPAKLLLIHGEKDEEVPVEHTLNIAAAALDEGVKVWVLPNTGHCRAYVDDPQAYFRRVLDFVEEAVPARLFMGAAG
jgi:fermentation-respiration switch protein FrsA (DUF1100 family)